MKKHPLRICVIAIIAAAIQSTFLTSIAQAQNYTFKDLFTLGVPAGFTPAPSYNAVGAGSGGQVVGNGTGNRADSGSGGGIACVWSPASPSGISLYPGDVALGTNGIQQVGYLDVFSPSVASHAALWSGNSGSTIDLNPTPLVSGVPAPWPNSYALSVAGTQQVGWGSPDGAAIHAVLWSGSATGFVDLNPTGYINSEAVGVGGGKQVGFALSTTANRNDALLWSGSAASVVDLSPSNFSDSRAIATDGQKQVGWGTSLADNSAHALLWSGTAQSVVDLGLGFAFSIVGGKEVGLDGNGHATVWSGSAASAINLSALMPISYQVQEFVHSSLVSSTLSIDTNGNIFGVAFDNSTALYHAIEFTPTPEPSTFILSGVGVLSILLRRNRKCDKA